DTARRLCDQHGVVLIFDEVISAFRYRAGDVGQLYGIHSDLLTMGKVIGGGMPVAAVGGKAEIMDQIGRSSGAKVKFSGGTYSGHPASMLAARVLVKYLIENETNIYPELGRLGRLLRTMVLVVFDQAGVLARFAGGESKVLANNSLQMLVIPYKDKGLMDQPNEVLDPEKVDITLTEKVLKLAMLLEDVHIIHGLGALSTAHTEADIERVCGAFGRALDRIK
ncbi:MAG: aminotransferase class III-fold pyridoxal phosphate-dependent enzyme, partial [Thermoleophilia bacterium]|nr:aminotransferase class III-fold pyridoxal phosphate-dependent enzyme [Thermoleophilia bacterium]